MISALDTSPPAQAATCQFRLSRAAPAASCALPVPPPIIAVIPVRPVDNPASAPIDLRIRFVQPGGSVTRLAPVSLYPVDQPQTFAVRLPRKRGRLAISLIPGPRPVTIEVGPIGWRAAEP